MNLVNYANRLYARGHVAEDFHSGGGLKPGLVIVSPVRPPGFTENGIVRTDNMQKVPGQYALSHIVESVGYPQSPDAVRVDVGDVVKCREAHLDILDPSGNLMSIRDIHIVAVIGHDDSVAPEVQPVPS